MDILTGEERDLCRMLCGIESPTTYRVRAMSNIEDTYKSLIQKSGMYPVDQASCGKSIFLGNGDVTLLHAFQLHMLLTSSISSLGAMQQIPIDNTAYRGCRQRLFRDLGQIVMALGFFEV